MRGDRGDTGDKRGTKGRSTIRLQTMVATSGYIYWLSFFGEEYSIGSTFHYISEVKEVIQGDL